MIPHPRRGTLHALLGLGALGLLGGLPLVQSLPSQAAGTVLYNLNTRCSLAEGAPQACRVEAIDEGTATLYRHQIGTEVRTVRIMDEPVRMELWNATEKRWQPLNSAAARFSTNTICFNGRDLCVVNANYLNSVRQEKPAATAGRDLVMVRFDGSGRVNLSCYDEGCQEVKP